MAPPICPHCGASVPSDAKACPECGSDEETGWSTEARQSNEPELGLPDEDFDYDEFTRREFGKTKPARRGMHWFWWIVALFVLAAVLCLRFF